MFRIPKLIWSPLEIITTQYSRNRITKPCFCDFRSFVFQGQFRVAECLEDYHPEVRQKCDYLRDGLTWLECESGGADDVNMNNFHKVEKYVDEGLDFGPYF